MAAIRLRGRDVPPVGFGTFQLHGEACTRAVSSALELGYRHLDTAAIYSNEDRVGEAVARSGVPREDLFVTTKIWIDDLAARRTERAAEEGLRRLRMDHVDLLLVHWPVPEVPLAETLAAMMRVREAGLTREIGVSNFPPSMLREALELAPIFCNQVEYHPFLAQSKLLAIAEEFDMLLAAYAPVALGRATRDPVLTGIGEQYGKSAAQVALRYLVEHRNVAVLPKSGDTARQRENLDIFNFTLTPEDRDRIDGLAAGYRIYDMDWAPDWED